MTTTAELPIEKPPDPGTCSDIVDRLRATELARSRTVFEQYELAAQLLGERVAERIAAGQPRERWETGVASEIAQALRISPSHGAALLSRARELRKHLPHTRERLREGALSPEAVRAVITGLAHLEPADRERADAILSADPRTLAGLGIKRLRNEVQRVAYELDRQGTVDHLAKEAKNRRVTLQPVPTVMARLSILLPVAQGVGALAALRKAASALFGVAASSARWTRSWPISRTNGSLGGRWPTGRT